MAINPRPIQAAFMNAVGAQAANLIDLRQAAEMITENLTAPDDEAFWIARSQILSGTCLMLGALVADARIADGDTPPSHLLLGFDLGRDLNEMVIAKMSSDPRASYMAGR